MVDVEDGAVEVAQALVVKSNAQKRMVIGKDGSVVLKLQEKSEPRCSQRRPRKQSRLTVTTEYYDENKREALSTASIRESKTTLFDCLFLLSSLGITLLSILRSTLLLKLFLLMISPRTPDGCRGSCSGGQKM